MRVSRDTAVHPPIRQGDILQPAINVKAEILVSAVVFILKSICHLLGLGADSLQHSDNRGSGVSNAHDAAQAGTYAQDTQLLASWEHAMCFLYDYLSRIIEPEGSVYKVDPAAANLDRLEEGSRC